MGTKLLWTGLTIVMLSTVWTGGLAVLGIVGVVIMIIGLLLLWLDK